MKDEHHSDNEVEDIDTDENDSDGENDAEHRKFKCLEVNGRLSQVLRLTCQYTELSPLSSIQSLDLLHSRHKVKQFFFKT